MRASEEQEVKSHQQLLREYIHEKADYERKFNITLVVLVVLIALKVLLRFV